MNCKVCGNELEEQAVFCTSCGAKVEETGKASVQTDTAFHVTAGLSEVEEALREVEEKTDDMPVEMIKSADEKLGDMMDKADIMVSGLVEEQTEEANDNKAEEVTEENAAAGDYEGITPATAAVEAVISESRSEKKTRIKLEKAEAKHKYIIAKNPVAVTVFNVILAIAFTGILFMAVSTFMLAHSSFDEFYRDVVFADIVANIDFWVLTCSWYAIALYVILALLALLMFFVLKKRKYAILNYVGISAIVNGAVFLLIGYFGSKISDIFSFTGIMEEIFDVVAGAAGEMIIRNAVILLGFGVVAVFVYTVTSVIHKAAYRRKCRKAEKQY